MDIIKNDKRKTKRLKKDDVLEGKIVNIEDKLKKRKKLTNEDLLIFQSRK